MKTKPLSDAIADALYSGQGDYWAHIAIWRWTELGWMTP